MDELRKTDCDTQFKNEINEVCGRFGLALRNARQNLAAFEAKFLNDGQYDNSSAESREPNRIIELVRVSLLQEAHLFTKLVNRFVGLSSDKDGLALVALLLQKTGQNITGHYNDIEAALISIDVQLGALEI